MKALMLTVGGTALILGAGLGGGSVVIVNLPSADFTVTDQTSMNSAFASVTSGQIIEVADSVIGIDLSIPSGTYTGVTLRGAIGHRLTQLSFPSVIGLTVDGLNFGIDNSAGSDNNGTNAFAFIDVTGTTHSCTVTNCVLDGDTGIGVTRSTEARLNKRFTGADFSSGTFTGGTGFTFDNCAFSRMYDAIVCSNVYLTVQNCNFSQIYIDAITGVVNNLAGTGKGWTIDRNTATLFEGVNKRRYTVSSVTGGDPVPGDTFATGNYMIEVVSYDSVNSYVYGAYNNFRIPQVSQTYSGTGAATGKSFTIDTIAAAGVYDGKHGDFLQPIKDSAASGNVPMTITRNHIYRTNAYDLTQFNMEQNTQGIFLRDNGSTIVYDPIDVRWNVVACGQSAGLKITDAANGHISYNAVLWQEWQGADRSRFELSGIAATVTVTKNVGDETQSTSNWYNDLGGNSFTDTGNLYVDGNDGSQDTAYAAWDTYPQTLANLSPAPSGTIDTNAAGPLTTAGVFRG